MNDNISPKRALIVVDAQNEYFGGGLPIEYPPAEQSVANIARAMDAAHATGVPVVVVQQMGEASAPVFAEGTEGWELHPDVAARPHDHAIRKQWPSAFKGTDLRQWLADRGIDTVAVTGYMTQNCVASTIYEAAHSDLAVEFLVDASGTLPLENAAGSSGAEEIHATFSVVFQSRFAAVVDTSQWIALVNSDEPATVDNPLTSNQRARERREAA